MSEETRIAEESVEQEATAEADVSQPEAAPEAEPTAASNEASTEDAGEAAETESAEPVVAESSEPSASADAEAEAVTAAADGEAAVAEAEVDEEGDVEASDADAEAEAEAGEAEGAEREDSGDQEDKEVVYLSVGQKVEGVVKRTTDFGAFVDIGAGRDGLIHISELAVGRVNKVTDVVNEGQQVTCWIKKLDRKRNRISLTLISPDTKTIKDLQEGEVVQGKVTKIMPYGAFIDIGVGTDGLLHIREMSTGYVNKPEDVVKTGEELEVRIIGVDRRRRRIDLSLKGLRDEPEAEQDVAVIDETDEGPVLDDPYADVEVLSPMELAFKRAMEAEGMEVDVKQAAKKAKRRRKKSRAIQEEIINRTLEAMRE